MNRKLFFILTATVLFITISCHGSFTDPGMMDQPGGGFSGSGSGDGGTKPATPPSGVTASEQSSNSIKITWTAVSGASEYNVYKSTNAYGQYNKLGSVTDTSYTDTGLTANTTYYYKVSAYNIYGESSQSASVSAKTLSSGSENNPNPLTANNWTNGEIKADTPNKEIWYSFTVTKDTTYYVWWNDRAGTGTTSTTGDGTKTLNVRVDASYSGGSSIFTNEDYAWTAPKQFKATSNGTVKLKVYPNSSTSQGSTFAIV